MAAGWYCKVMGQVLGPMPLAQVMDLAREGTLKPGDMVRKKTGEWVVGEAIKGLFPTPAAEPTVTESGNRASESAAPA